MPESFNNRKEDFVRNCNRAAEVDQHELAHLRTAGGEKICQQRHVLIRCTVLRHDDVGDIGKAQVKLHDGLQGVDVEVLALR